MKRQHICGELGELHFPKVLKKVFKTECFLSVLPTVSCVYLGNITDGDLIMIYTKYHYQGCQMNLRLLST